MESTKIYLIRHGEVEGHEERRYNGQNDVPLTAKGEAEYGMLMLKLQKKPFTAVYSSDLSRCKYGAELIGGSHGLQPNIDPALRELHLGDWEGRTWDELQASYPDEWISRLQNIVHHQISNGESVQDMADRVIPAVRAIAEKHVGEEVLIVAHGGVNRIVLLDALGAPYDLLFGIEQDYGCLNMIEYFADGNAVIKLMNA